MSSTSPSAASSPAGPSPAEQVFAQEYDKTFVEFVRHVVGQGVPVNERVMEGAHERATCCQWRIERLPARRYWRNVAGLALATNSKEGSCLPYRHRRSKIGSAESRYDVRGVLGRMVSARKPRTQGRLA